MKEIALAMLAFSVCDKAGVDALTLSKPRSPTRQAVPKG
jgi:hypothetical protein